MEQPDFIEAGGGEKVILVHSSVAGARQWRSLMEVLAPDFHVIAINLFGYGKTRAWDGDGTQRLADQARLIEPFLPEGDGKVSIVGHSFGGSVAMMAAAMFRHHVERLVLIEPNPFYLLKLHGRFDAYEEAVTLRNAIKESGKAGAWDAAAAVFADYWTGAGSWDAMSEDRRAKFAHALAPNYFEWDAVLNEDKPLAEWRRDLPRETTFVLAKDTVRSIREIAGLMQEHAPDWHFREIERGGHMAALSEPDEINRIVVDALS